MVVEWNWVRSGVIYDVISATFVLVVTKHSIHNAAKLHLEAYQICIVSLASVTSIDPSCVEGAVAFCR